MDLLAFRVQKYKNVIDSAWIDILHLTVLVGKNEAGKTSLLRALLKFNSFDKDSYHIDSEWPRGLRKERDEKHVVCSVKFNLSQEEIDQLAELTNMQMNIDYVEVTKNYAGEFEVLFPEAIFPNCLHPKDIDEICKNLDKPDQPVGDQFQQEASKCYSTVLRLAKEGRFSELEDIAATHIQSLQSAFSPNNQQPQFNNEQSFVDQYSNLLSQIQHSLEQKPSMRKKAHEYVVNRLPIFIYMDDYRTFQGSAHLDQVKQRKDQKKSTEEDKTLLMILKLSGLDLNTLVRQGGEEDREQRQYDLNDGGLTLTREIEGRWRQLRYEVNFSADGQQFFTFVKSVNDSKLIKLEERSKGFQWFFSFDLMFMYESQGKFKGCVLLLDEPGLHLHPEAQRDLLLRLEEYAKDNTLIYSTHLPFMIDLRHPERIHIITESGGGVVVSTDLTGTKPDEKLTLQAALGIGGETSFLLSKLNLVVEGVDDYWILSELSHLFVRAEKEGLNDDIFITAAGGASEAAYIGTLMIGQNLDVVVLLDSDPAGDQARDKLVKTWLTRYRGKTTQVLSLGEVVGFPNQEFSIEDLFSDSFYWQYVEKVYSKQISNFKDIKLETVTKKQLCKRVDEAFKKVGQSFNKGSVSKEIRNALGRLKGLDELSKETIEKVEKIFHSVNNAFPKKC